MISGSRVGLAESRAGGDSGTVRRSGPPWRDRLGGSHPIAGRTTRLVACRGLFAGTANSAWKGNRK